MHRIKTPRIGQSPDNKNNSGLQEVRQRVYGVFSQLGIIACDASIFAALSLVSSQTLCSDWAVPTEPLHGARFEMNKDDSAVELMY